MTKQRAYILFVVLVAAFIATCIFVKVRKGINKISHEAVSPSSGYSSIESKTPAFTKKAPKRERVKSSKASTKEERDRFLEETEEFLAQEDSVAEESYAEKSSAVEMEKEDEIIAGIEKRKKRIDAINLQIQRLDEHVQLLLDEANAIGDYAVIDLGNTFLTELKEHSRAVDEAESLEEVESIPPPMSPEEWIQKTKELTEQRKEILDVVNELNKDRRSLIAERKQLEQLNEVAPKSLQH